MVGQSEGHQLECDFFFRQLFDRESCTYTYLLADVNSKDAVIIDPVLDWAERDAKIIKELDFTLLYCINTHLHAGHITGSGKLKKLIPGCRSVISRSSGALADIYTEPGDRIEFGRHSLVVRSTPGHTAGCMTYVCYEQGIAFPGDAIMVRGCGRTDLEGGDPERLYKSVHTEIFTLPDHFKLYPTHDYKGRTVTTVREEKMYNPKFTKPLKEFVDIMNNLYLPVSKKIAIARPANRVCGIQE